MFKLAHFSYLLADKSIMFYKFKVIKYRNPYAAFAILLPIIASLAGLGLYVNALLQSLTSDNPGVNFAILLALGIVVALALVIPLVFVLIQWAVAKNNIAKGFQSLFYTYMVFAVASLLMFLSSLLVWGFSWTALAVVFYQVVAAALNYLAMKETGNGLDKDLQKEAINIVKTSYQRFEKYE